MSRLLRRLAEQSHTREKKLFSRSLLRSAKILLQNRAIECNAMRTSFRMVVSEKHAAQGHEKLRKRPSLNYKSAALDQLSYAGTAPYESCS